MPSKSIQAITATPSIEKRILDIYEDLPPGERALADRIMEHKNDFVGYSATELAKQADVSKATAARLFKRLGYGSFEEARQIARTVRHWGSPLKQLEARVDSAVSVDKDEHLSNDQANLRRTFERVDQRKLDAALEILATGQTVWIIGLRNSYGLAHLARFMLNMLRGDVRLIPQGGLSFAEEVLNMKPGDAMLAIGFRRRPMILRAVLAKAREAGVGIVLLTDVSASRTAELSDVVFRCHSKGAYLYDSYAAAVSVLNFLCTSLALRLGDSSLGRLKQIDELHDELDLFSHSKRRTR